MSEAIIAKYPLFQRLDDVCTIADYLLTQGANDLEEVTDALISMCMTYPEHVVETGLLMNVEVLAASLKPKNRSHVHAHFMAIQKHLHDITDQMEAGKPLVAHFPSMTPEPFIAMDLAYMCAEQLSLYLVGALTDGVEEILDASEADGIPGHSCGFQRAPFKAMETGQLPMPDMFMCTTAPCNSSNMLYQMMMQRYDIPMFVCDSPYYWNDRSFDYFKEEYKRCLQGISELTGHTIDVDVLRERVEMSNRQLQYMYELQQLRRLKPNPDPGMHRAMDLAAWLMAGSNEECITYQKMCYDEAKARADKGLGVIPEGMKEIRTLHTYGWTAHFLSFPDWLEDELGSTELECGLSIYPGELVGLVDTTSLDTMLDGLAWRSFNAVMHRTVMTFSDLHIQDMVSVATEYDAEVALFAGNNTCKWGWTYPKMLTEALQDNLGIPCLTWETDLMDKRFRSPEDVKEMCREFFNTVRMSEA